MTMVGEAATAVAVEEEVNEEGTCNQCPLFLLRQRHLALAILRLEVFVLSSLLLQLGKVVILTI
jgi:hypothetical protein